MFGKQNRKAFTLIELLVVVAIIALLVSIMVPAVQNAMDIAKDGVVKTQFHNIEIGAEMFKHDRLAGNGDYPDGTWTPPGGLGLAGHISLPIQLVGRDLRGYDPTDLYSEDPTSASFRVGPYIKRESAEFINVDPSANRNPEDALPVMLCKWGEPILYFRARPGSTAEDLVEDVYELGDWFLNRAVEFNLGRIADWQSTYADGTNHSNDPLVKSDNSYENFYEEITNDALEEQFNLEIPYRADSFLLWSAGKDKEYGTEDDVTNFK